MTRANRCRWLAHLALPIVAPLIACLAEPAHAQTLMDKTVRDEVIEAPDDPDMIEAFRKARTTLPGFFAAATDPQPGTRTFAVKFGVPTRRGTEYLWALLLRRENGRVIGRIDNTPRWTTRIREGQTIAIEENRIVDWLYLDGPTMKGNFTACVIHKRFPQDEVRDVEQRFGKECGR